MGIIGLASLTNFREGYFSLFRNSTYCIRGNELVIISKDSYISLQKTLYLLCSPNNSKYLKESINQYKTGKVTKLKPNI